MVVPWTVKSWLYVSGLRRRWFGSASCVRITRAMRPDVKKKKKAV